MVFGGGGSSMKTTGLMTMIIMMMRSCSLDAECFVCTSSFNPHINSRIEPFIIPIFQMRKVRLGGVQQLLKVI